MGRLRIRSSRERAKETGRTATPRPRSRRPRRLPRTKRERGRQVAAPIVIQANDEERVAKPKDVDSYIANSASEARPILEELRKVIKSTVPDVEEGISWGVPFYRYHGALAGFAAYKNHVSFGVGADVLQGNDRENA